MTSGALTPYRDAIKFFETVRICMAKWDAEERTARSLPIPADVSLLLRQLTAGAIEAGGVTDLYEAAGLPRPDLSHLDQASSGCSKRATHIWPSRPCAG